MVATEASILNADQERFLRGKVKKWIATAEGAPPELAKFSSAEEYKKAKQAYESNPIAVRIQKFQTEQNDEHVKLIANKGDAAKADQFYQSNLKQLSGEILSSGRTGEIDPNSDQKKIGAWASAARLFMQKEYFAAVKEVLFSMGFMGDLAAAGGKMLVANVKDPGSMGFGEARERVTMERAFRGIAQTLGVQDVDRFAKENTQEYFEEKHRNVNIAADNAQRQPNVTGEQKPLTTSAVGAALGENKGVVKGGDHVNDGTPVAPNLGIGGGRTQGAQV